MIRQSGPLGEIRPPRQDGAWDHSTCRSGAVQAPPSRAGASERITATRRRGVLLINLGEPEAPDGPSVRRYLTQLLSDTEVIRLPRMLWWLNPVLGRVLSGIHAARFAERYRKIWTDAGSPLLAITQEQASALAAKLPDGMRVFCAMRYGRPGIAEVVRSIRALGIEDLVVIPMFPHYSGRTTRTIVRELYRQIESADFRIDATMRGSWYEDVGYINAQARLIDDYATAHGLTPENTQLVYSAHSLPVSCTEPGDPYVGQIRRTAELVTRRLDYPPTRTALGYQSYPGQVKGLRPTTSEVLARLSRAHEKQVLVCPLGFTADSLDTLEAIQMRYRGQFERDGGRLFACPALNTFEPFIAALRKLALHGKHSTCHHALEPDPPAALSVEDAEAPLDSLVMVGVSLGGPLGPGRGPRVMYADADQFRKAKKPRCDVPDMLRAVCDGAMVREALLWNTCRRFEFYGWLNGIPDRAGLAEAVAHVRRHLFNHGGQIEASVVNVLRGADAWHHLTRTAAGLNSGLPGEREVLEQLHTAQRVAERAGTGGLLVDRLLADISKRVRRLREQTEWGQYEPNHCHAAISPIVQSVGLDLPDCRCVVIGGSTTSCGILDTLAEHFDVARRRLTLLHRGHGQGGHLKMLRKAIGGGRRIRVNRYDERIAIRAITDADLVFFGLDCREPVLDARKIRGSRDFSVRPLAIFDFNLFGSTVGMEDLDGVRVWNAADLEAAATAYAEDMCGGERFARAAAAAESWICDHVPVGSGDRGEWQAPGSVHLAGARHSQTVPE